MRAARDDLGEAEADALPRRHVALRRGERGDEHGQDLRHDVLSELADEVAEGGARNLAMLFVLGGELADDLGDHARHDLLQEQRRVRHDRLVANR